MVEYHDPPTLASTESPSAVHRQEIEMKLTSPALFFMKLRYIFLLGLMAGHQVVCRLEQGKP